MIALFQAYGQDAGGKPANVTDLGFKYQDGSSKFEISFDKAVTFEKSLSEADKQVIVDVTNAKIGKKFKRALDTSSYNSNVTLISPYQSGDRVRITFQLIENGSVEISQDGKKLVAMIDNKKTGDNKTADAAKAGLSDKEKEGAAPEAASPAAAEQAPPAPDAAAASASPENKVSSDSLDGFFEAQRSRNFVGKRIYLQVKDTELADVFQIISEASEFNIVLDDSVKGKILLNLADVPWDQALDLIIRSYRLAAERFGNVLRITTADNLKREKENEAAVKKAAEATEPLVVKIFPISFAKIGDIKTIITDFLTRDAQQTGATISLRGSIQIDARTNSLIVRDTPSTMEKVTRIIKELDTQTPQILIEAKFVSVAEQYGKTVDGRIFATTRELSPTTGGYTVDNSRNNFSSVFGGSSANVNDAGFVVTPAAPNGGAAFGFMPKAGLLPGLSEIGAFISILENESHAKVIASPRVVTQNKEVATITQGTNVTIALQGAVPGSSSTVQTIQLLLNLKVTPQVTNEGSIIMNVDFSQTTPSAAPAGVSNAVVSADTKSVQSTVLVDSGATLVIGGIYQNAENSNEFGIPILRDLPILGPFFGTKIKATNKNELFIFLSPRILNDREIGMRG
jgi:type IV pilus assembly protein PilQ